MTDHVDYSDLMNYDYDTGKETLSDYYLASLLNEILERLDALEKHVTLQ